MLASAVLLRSTYYFLFFSVASVSSVVKTLLWRKTMRRIAMFLIPIILFASGCMSIDPKTVFEGLGPPVIKHLPSYTRTQVYNAAVKVTREYFMTNVEKRAHAADVIITGFMRQASASAASEVPDTYLSKCRITIESPRRNLVVLKILAGKYERKDRQYVRVADDVTTQQWVLSDIEAELVSREKKSFNIPTE
jgi:hypothetical protein